MALPVALLAGVASRVGATKIITDQVTKQVRQQSIELFGYDFYGLAIKLLVFFTFAFIVAKVMEGIILVRGAFVVIANLLGFKIPTSEQIPESLKKLFIDGYQGFKFWDIIKILALVLVIAEYFMYNESMKKNGGKVSPMTHGVFLVIVLSLSVTTVPELLQRIKKTDFNLASGV